MKNARIDGASLTSKEELLSAFAAALDFPAWFGRNLDALFDCLCDCHPETAVTLVHTDALGETLGVHYVTALVHLLTRAAEENKDLTVFIFPQEGY